MSSGIDCGKLEEVLESIFQIPVDAARLDKWVNGGEFETVVLGGREVPTLRNLVRQIDERSSQAAEEEINEAKAEIGALAEKLKAKIDELKAMTASAETLPPDHPATVYYNAGTGEFEFGIPQGKQGIQGEQGLAPAVDIIYGGDPSDEALSIIYGGNPALDEPGDRTIVRQVARIGTSAQWATANPVLEDGESGYERTPEGKLLWKTGDGVTHWNDLPYPSILVDKIYRYRGSVATVEDLPTDAAEGDVYNITSTGANYAWTGTQWDNLGVVQEIDPAPVKDSGNPVASGGVYAALEDMQTDIAATGAPDDVTIIKNESGKLVAQDIAIGGDPADLASDRGLPVAMLTWNGSTTWDATLLAGTSLRHITARAGTTAVPVGCSVLTTKAQSGAVRRGAQLAIQDSATSGVAPRTFLRDLAADDIQDESELTVDRATAWNEFLTAGRIGDGITVNNGIPAVPEYEGATATEPGTAGLVPPATVEEKDKYLKGDGTYGSGLAASVFTPPTESAPGTAGLVPGPEATPDVDRLLNYLSVEGWRKLSTSMFSPDLSGSDSQELGLAGVATDSFDANTIITGYYHSNNWTNAPGGSGLLISVPVRDNTAANYAIVQIFFSYIGPSSYRTLRQGIPVGTTPAIDNWAEWQSINSPRPQAATGVGQWVGIGQNGSSVTLPAGGSWAYHVYAYNNSQGMVLVNDANVAAGGTVLEYGIAQPSTTLVCGFAWRIA